MAFMSISAADKEPFEHAADTTYSFLMQGAWRRLGAHFLSLQTSGAGGSVAPIMAALTRRCERSAAAHCKQPLSLRPH